MIHKEWHVKACGGANYWAREFIALGHQVKLIAPQYVKPYVKGNKNDYNDAEAIAEAAQRPNMRFVPIKSVVGCTPFSGQVLKIIFI